ncbi:AAA family ATPase [Pelagibacterium sp. H642]|uniref:AAA family ATPase n=1 Tax=Pelagibacterium sp. H642 TaxID=1881069 RepID=UPI0028160C27|nr:AAA family ATPase [Pelagibacterium sp. H642]WMT91001.1 AAA family ATPase [Pelagibacterium sp. H642]
MSAANSIEQSLLEDTDPSEGIRTHIQVLHDLAAGIDGVLVAATYYTGHTGGSITHHAIGDVDGMAGAIAAHLETPGANSYVGLQVMRRGLQRGKRGTEADIVAVLGLVADMDADTGNAGGEYPLPPNYIVESSAGNLQAFWLFDRPVTPAVAKEIAAGLQVATASDHCTKDITHVWRVPGTLNHPNAKKLERGRSPAPQPVRVAQPWDGTYTDPAALALAVAGRGATANESKAIELGDLPSVDGIEVSPRAAEKLARNLDPGEDRSGQAYAVVEQLHFDGHTAEEAAALFMAATGNWTSRYRDEAHMRSDFARMWGKREAEREKEREQAEKFAKGLGKPANDNEPLSESKRRERFELTWFDNIENSKPKKTFIKGVFGENEFSYIVGKPGTGKSVITTDMACHVAAGMDWHGRRVKQGLVVYLAAERKDLTERRMLAFRKRHGVKDVPLLVVGGRIDLTGNLNDARTLAKLINQAAEACEMPCVWIIIDTLTRTFGGGDQNATKDMSAFVQSCDEILNLTKAHVTVIHHTGWSTDRAKGSIDLDGAVDASFIVNKIDGKYVLACDGTNDGEAGVVTHFRMESVEVGVDEDGEPTTAPVVVQVDDKPKKLTTGKSVHVLEALSHAIEKDGIEPAGHHFPDDILAVTEEQWRAAYYEHPKASENEDTRVKQFSRGRTQLLERERVGNIGNWYWLNEAPE